MYKKIQSLNNHVVQIFHLLCRLPPPAFIELRGVWIYLPRVHCFNNPALVQSSYLFSFFGVGELVGCANRTLFVHGRNFGKRGAQLSVPGATCLHDAATPDRLLLCQLPAVVPGTKLSLFVLQGGQISVEAADTLQLQNSCKTVVVSAACPPFAAAALGTQGPVCQCKTGFVAVERALWGQVCQLFLVVQCATPVTFVLLLAGWYYEPGPS